MRYGACYLNTSLWKRQREDEPLVDPMVSHKAQDSTFKEQLQEQVCPCAEIRFSEHRQWLQAGQGGSPKVSGDKEAVKVVRVIEILTDTALPCTHTHTHTPSDICPGVERKRKVETPEGK